MSAKRKISPETAYKAMFEFLLKYNSRGETDEIRILLGGLSLLQDGISADPALLADWNDAIDVIVQCEARGEAYEPIKFKLL